MFGLGIGELIVIFLVIFFLFGPRALPDIARSLGEMVKRFREEVNKINTNIVDSVNESPSSSKSKAQEEKLPNDKL